MFLWQATYSERSFCTFPSQEYCTDPQDHEEPYIKLYAQLLPCLGLLLTSVRQQRSQKFVLFFQHDCVNGFSFSSPVYHFTTVFYLFLSLSFSCLKNITCIMLYDEKILLTQYHSYKEETIFFLFLVHLFSSEREMLPTMKHNIFIRTWVTAKMKVNISRKDRFRKSHCH